MTKRYGRILGSAVLVGGLALAGASTANAQVSFRGSFPLPSGRISVNIGDPVYRVGAFAPDDCDIYVHPDYGYGFISGGRFVPVREYQGRWIVTSAPTRFSRRYDDWRYARVYRRASERRIYDRRYDRRDDRRYDRRDDRRDSRDYRDNRDRQDRDRQDRRWDRDRRD